VDPSSIRNELGSSPFEFRFVAVQSGGLWEKKQKKRG
jgi:hypothetical protein